MAGLEDLKNIIILGRFHFVYGGLLLYGFGCLLAVSSGAPFDAGMFLFGYMIIFFANVAVNYANDYFDAEEDVSSTPTMFSGGSGVLVRRPGLAPAAGSIARAAVLLSLACAFAFVYIYSFDPVLLLYALIGNACGWYYSAPPLRFSHRLYGNVVFALTVCVLIPWFGNLVAAGTVTSSMAAYTVPLFFYGYAFTIGVQIPDIACDRLNNKKNFASTYGEKVSYLAIAALMVLGTLSLLLVPGIYVPQKDAVLFALLSLLPLAASVYGLLAKGRKTETRIMAIISSVFLLFMLWDAVLASRSMF